MWNLHILIYFFFCVVKFMNDKNTHVQVYKMSFTTLQTPWPDVSSNWSLDVKN